MILITLNVVNPLIFLDNLAQELLDRSLANISTLCRNTAHIGLFQRVGLVALHAFDRRADKLHFSLVQYTKLVAIIFRVGEQMGTV